MPIGGAGLGSPPGIAELPALHAPVPAPTATPTQVSMPAAGRAVAVPAPTGPAGGVLVPQPADPVPEAGSAVRLLDADLVPQMTGLAIASGAVALNMAAQRRALKAYRAVADPDEGLRRVPDADDAEQIGG